MTIVKFPVSHQSERPKRFYKSYSNMDFIAKLRMKLIKLLVGKGTVILNAHISIVDHMNDGIDLEVRNINFGIICDNNFDTYGIESKMFLIQQRKRD